MLWSLARLGRKTTATSTFLEAVTRRVLGGELRRCSMTTVANLAWAYATLGVLGKGGHMGICCGKKRCYSEVAIIDVECILVDRLVLIFKRTFNQLLQGGIAFWIFFPLRLMASPNMQLIGGSIADVFTYCRVTSI